MKILLAEDDPQLARSLAERIGDAGYVIDRVRTGDEVEAALAALSYGLLILDRRLPDGDSLARIKVFRRLNPDLRIIMLTALDRVFDRIEGLDAGADDYLTKPFDIHELLARIRAAMRRPGGVLQPPITCGRLQYAPEHREFCISGQSVVFKRREHQILEALMMRANRVVQRDVFLNQVYGFNEDIQSNTLDAHISRLRTKLVDLGAGVGIHPVRGVGYMLIES